MKKFFHLLFLTLIFPIAFFSCSGEATKEEKQDDSGDVVVEDGKTLLWKISGNGLDKPSYLFGTMHMISEEYFVFSDVLKEKIKSCEMVVMELPSIPDMGDATQLMIAPEGERIKDLASKEQYDTIIALVEEKLNMSQEVFEEKFGDQRPLAIISLASISAMEGKIESYEMSLIGLAKMNKIKIDGLETIKEQLGFFNSIPGDRMMDMLIESLKTAGKDDGMMDEMQKIYKSQDIEALGKFMIESSPELMEFEDILLTNRNKDWIPKIEAFAKSRKTFFAVGAAHLVGENGVINLLKEKGYTLTPISTEK